MSLSITLSVDGGHLLLLQQQLFIYLIFYLKKIMCRKKLVSEFLFENVVLGLWFAEKGLRSSCTSDLKLPGLPSFKKILTKMSTPYCFYTHEIQENPNFIATLQQSQSASVSGCYNESRHGFKMIPLSQCI